MMITKTRLGKEPNKRRHIATVFPSPVNPYTHQNCEKMLPGSPTSFFVYGTLKRGQCRDHLWPVSPQTITPAWIRATLYRRKDYPALQAGEDHVLGEVWAFEASEIPTVIEKLDQIEGTNQPNEPDLYHRRVVDCFDLNQGPLGRSYCYFYAIDPVEDGFNRVFPRDLSGHAEWDLIKREMASRATSDRPPVLPSFPIAFWPED